MVDLKSLVIPLAYIAVLIGSLITFSSLYRKRKAAASASLAPWFPAHLQRNVYLSLLHHEQTHPDTGKPVAVPDTVLKAALLRRAAADIDRIVALRGAKGALETLLARGSVGDDLWQRFQRADAEMKAEIEDVISEANALAPNWGQHIFQSANEIAANQRLRGALDAVHARTPGAREWWRERRARLRAELFKEVGETDPSAEAATTASDAAAAGDKGGEAAAPSGADKGLPTPPPTAGGSGGSSDEAVLVEGGGPSTGAPGQEAGAAAGKKKRKGKK